MHRAWVLMTRNRSGSFFQLERELEVLQEEIPAVFKRWMGLYGHFDALTIVEGETLQGIHQAVNMIQHRAGQSIFSTTTCLSIDPLFDNRHRYDDKKHQICVGIITQPGRQDEVRTRLESVHGFDLADVVFGEFDVMALFRPPRGTLHALRDAIRGIDYIQKTTTMIPHSIPVED